MGNLKFLDTVTGRVYGGNKLRIDGSVGEEGSSLVIEFTKNQSEVLEPIMDLVDSVIESGSGVSLLVEKDEVVGTYSVVVSCLSSGEEAYVEIADEDLSLNQLAI